MHRMNFEKLTIKSQQAIKYAETLAMDKGQQSVEIAHILLGIYHVDEHVLPHLLKKLNANPELIKQTLF